jgi:hypothetical protein
LSSPAIAGPGANAAGSQAPASSPQQEPLPKPFPSWILVSVVTAPLVVGLVIFTWAGGSGWQALPTGALISLAAAALGAFLGFLFGIPKSLTRGAPAPLPPVAPSAATDSRSSTNPATSTTGASPPGGYGANTNLEEISDWLTKILVGAGLVELGNLVRGMGTLANSIGQQLGGETGSAAFGISLVIYAAVVGFLLCYVPTRVELPKLLRSADAKQVAAAAQRAAGEAQQTADDALKASTSDPPEARAQAWSDAVALSQTRSLIARSESMSDEDEIAAQQAYHLASVQALTQVGILLDGAPDGSNLTNVDALRSILNDEADARVSYQSRLIRGDDGDSGS